MRLTETTAGAWALAGPSCDCWGKPAVQRKTGGISVPRAPISDTPPFPPGDFAIQILLPAALTAQLIPGAEAEPDYSTTSLWKFASTEGGLFP